MQKLMIQPSRFSAAARSSAAINHFGGGGLGGLGGGGLGGFGGGGISISIKDKISIYLLLRIRLSLTSILSIEAAAVWKLEFPSNVAPRKVDKNARKKIKYAPKNYSDFPGFTKHNRITQNASTRV